MHIIKTQVLYIIKPTLIHTCVMIYTYGDDIPSLSAWIKKFQVKKTWNFLAPQTGLEPVTPRLTAACSTDWAIRAYKAFSLMLNYIKSAKRWCYQFSRTILSGLLCWRRPIFPGGFPPSIFGTIELNYRVRNGNGWTLNVINTNCYAPWHIIIYSSFKEARSQIWWPVADSNRCCRRERPES